MYRGQFACTVHDKADTLPGCGHDLFCVAVVRLFLHISCGSTGRVEMSLETMAGGATPEHVQQAHSPLGEKSIEDAKHLEGIPASTANLVYSHDDEEPELHARTYFAVAAMFLLNMVQVLALQGPPAVVSNSRETNSMAGLVWAD